MSSPVLSAIQTTSTLDLFVRETNLQEVRVFAGPTNSGKTFQSLNQLFSDYENAGGVGTFVYAGPLRMLAYEVYERMAAKFGEEQVGFITGEEQINPEAPLLACTVEMAPKLGDSLVLDETHWMIDEDRGHHWTKLLTSGSYRNMYILAAYEALGTVLSLTGDADHTDIVTLERKTPLNYAGKTQLLSIPPRTAVIAFSRKKVYEIAHALAKGGKKVGVLYGSLPLRTRNEQIRRYLDGTYDIMVTTDVIGHGINLPIDNVVFAQTDKFDGTSMRALYTWELAQIAGRAGRFGLSNEGRVFLLDASELQRNSYPNETLLKEGVLAGNGSKRTDLITERAFISPQLHELQVTNPQQLLEGLQDWATRVENEYGTRHIAPSPMTTVKTLLCRIAEHYEAPLSALEPGQWGIPLETVWELVSGPFNPKGATVLRVSEWLLEDHPEDSHLLDQYMRACVTPELDKPLQYNEEVGSELIPLETALGVIAELKMVNIMFGTTGTLLYSELLEYEELISARLSREVFNAVMKRPHNVAKPAKRTKKTRKSASQKLVRTR